MELDAEKIRGWIQEYKELLNVQEEITLKFNKRIFYTRGFKEGNSITLSYHFIKKNTEEGVKELVLHEMCHFVEFNHTQRFKNLFSKYSTGAKMITATRYNMFCQKCNERIGGLINLKKSKRYFCKVCNDQDGSMNELKAIRVV